MTKKTTTKTQAKPKKKSTKQALSNKELLIEALAKTKGIIATACKSVNVSRRTFYNWKEEDPEFAEAVEEIMENQIDTVESKLIDNIESGDTTAIIFYLKTKGRKRGYGDKLEVDNNLKLKDCDIDIKDWLSLKASKKKDKEQ